MLIHVVEYEPDKRPSLNVSGFFTITILLKKNAGSNLNLEDKVCLKKDFSLNFINKLQSVIMLSPSTFYFCIILYTSTSITSRIYVDSKNLTILEFIVWKTLTQRCRLFVTGESLTLELTRNRNFICLGNLAFFEFHHFEGSQIGSLGIWSRSPY